MMTRINRIDIYDKSAVRNNLNDENIQTWHACIQDADLRSSFWAHYSFSILHSQINLKWYQNAQFFYFTRHDDENIQTWRRVHPGCWSAVIILRHTTVFLFYTAKLVSNGIKITAMMTQMNCIDIYDRSQ